MNADPRLERRVGAPPNLRIQASKLIQQVGCGAHRAFGIAFVSPRIAEIHQDAVADESRNEAAVALHRGQGQVLVSMLEYSEILGVELPDSSV